MESKNLYSTIVAFFNDLVRCGVFDTVAEFGSVTVLVSVADSMPVSLSMAVTVFVVGYVSVRGRVRSCLLPLMFPLFPLFPCQF